MYSYDWIVLVTLGLDRWEQERPPGPHEIELREARKQYEAETRKAATVPRPARKGLRARLIRRRQGRQEAAACSS